MNKFFLLLAATALLCDPIHAQEQTDSVDEPVSNPAPVIEDFEEVAVEESVNGTDSAVVEVVPHENRGKEWDLPVALDPRFRIGKIHDFLNDRNVTPTGGHRSLEFEHKYFNHGAITRDQVRSRVGRYYVVSWANRGEPTNVTLRLDYRQRKTRDRVRTIEIPYNSAAGNFKGTFSITGDTYYSDGDVNSWRISLVHDGKIVAQEKSFVW